MENIMNTNLKKERLKLTPEQLFNLYLECNAPGAPVKPILERYGLRPWDLIAIRKKVKAAAMEASCSFRETRPKATGYSRRTVSKNIQRTRRNQRRACCRRARAVLVKKKDELELKGPLKGHFEQEVKRAVVNVINEVVTQGLTQKRACQIFGIAPRKFRRWVNPRQVRPRTAWNKTLAHERDAIETAAWTPELIGKPVSHIFVHGHESGKFFASLSTVYHVLKAKNMVEPRKHWYRRTPYVSAHALLEEGFSLLCYDGT